MSPKVREFLFAAVGKQDVIVFETLLSQRDSYIAQWVEKALPSHIDWLGEKAAVAVRALYESFPYFLTPEHGEQRETERLHDVAYGAKKWEAVLPPSAPTEEMRALALTLLLTIKHFQPR